jgi:glycosyltransferase involved in cell wall biosynthesis
MRVLFAFHGPRDPRTAVFRSIAERARVLVDAGHRVELVSPEDFPALWRRFPRWLPLVFPLLVWRRLGRSAAPPDVAVFHSWAGWPVNLFRRRRHPRSLRTITEFHGLEPLYQRALAAEHRRRGDRLSRRHRLLHGRLMPWLAALSCRRSDLALCLNSAERDWLLAHRWAPPGGVAIQPNGVDDRFFSDRPPPRQPRRLVFLGQWLPAKGIADLATAFTEIAAARPGVELCCAGTLTSEERVRAGFPADLQTALSVLPELDREGVAACLAAGDVFVFPSLSEGFSLALLEAMASGLPVVATPVGAAADLLTDGETALLVPPGRPHELAAAVLRLLDDAGLCDRLGRAARKIASGYRWQEVARGFLRRLEALVATGDGPP